jgi:hypothetical protein
VRWESVIPFFCRHSRIAFERLAPDPARRVAALAPVVATAAPAAVLVDVPAAVLVDADAPADVLVDAPADVLVDVDAPADVLFKDSPQAVTPRQASSRMMRAVVAGFAVRAGLRPSGFK